MTLIGMEFSFLISELHIWSEQFVGGAKKDCEFYTLLLWGPNPLREDIQAFQQKDAVYLSCEDLPVQLVAWGEETVLREKAQLFIASPLTRVELAAVEPTVLTVDLNPAKRPVLCPTTLHSCWHLGLNVLLSYVKRLL